MLSPDAPPSHLFCVFTNPEGRQILSLRVLMEGPFHRHDCLNHWPLVTGSFSLLLLWRLGGGAESSNLLVKASSFWWLTTILKLSKDLMRITLLEQKTFQSPLSQGNSKDLGALCQEPGSKTKYPFYAIPGHFCNSTSGPLYHRPNLISAPCLFSAPAYHKMVFWLYHLRVSMETHCSVSEAQSLDSYQDSFQSFTQRLVCHCALPIPPL